MNGIYSNPSVASNATSLTLATYEPKPQLPLSLKAVNTPANNPEYYKRLRQTQKEAQAGNPTKKHKGMMLPGTGFVGPNIYIRTLLAIQSGLPEEEEYALHHLVKISHERGDKYRFDQFPGLAEALIKKVLQISSFFYDVKWNMKYCADTHACDGSTLSGLISTDTVVRKMKTHTRIDPGDDIQTLESSHELGRIIEAGLIIRNMVMLEENAQCISHQPLLRDFLSIVLNLPPHPILVELQHYALEIAEQLTRLLQLEPRDPLYLSLLARLDSADRGMLVTSLRALARIGMSFPTNYRLENVPSKALKNVCDWLLVEDEELRSACLDFLHQFSTVVDNVEALVRDVNVEALVKQLSTLLLYNAKLEERRTKSKSPAEDDDGGSADVARLSKEVVEGLLRYEERERSSQWLRMCFRPDDHGEMTQISLWQAYQAAFLPYQATHPLLIAGDFIKNVSQTFTGASAQVAGQNKYVIRGIQPRAVPIDHRQRELVKCLWHTEHMINGHSSIDGNDGTAGDQECGEWFRDSGRMLEHILTAHLRIPKKNIQASSTDGTPAIRPTMTPNPLMELDFAAAHPEKIAKCRWGPCTHRPAITMTNQPAQKALPTMLLARHIQTHLPDTSPTSASKSRSSRPAPKETTATSGVKQTYLNTLVDDKNEAAGLPRSAALVLRNLARALPKISVEEKGNWKRGKGSAGEVKEEESLTKRIFGGVVMERIWFALAHNFVLREELRSIIAAVTAGGG
ncbi:Chromatin structure-remodeling complex protein rsc9 [Elasticomyces elasticus]|nr:Chromatin structure-remodeling complex protein rsc9 [Elasticomyces elasticus]